MLVKFSSIANLAIFANICTLAFNVPRQFARYLYSTGDNPRHQTIGISPAQQHFFMSSTRVAGQVGIVLSKTTDKELNSGLFRRMNYINKDFEFDEILSSDDVEEYRYRFQCLLKIFPEVSEGDLRALVFISPLLLALETETLKAAVIKLRHEVPFINPSYLITLRSCGLDLLLSSMSPSFDLEARQYDVVTVIGKERNVTEFLRRVPHCLTPRYLIALRDHCYIAKDMLQMDSRTSLNIVERWPGILGIDLSQAISRFNASLHRLELLNSDNTGSVLVSKILKAVPRCIMQDMPRRAALLRRNFPQWDLPVIIEKYPRVLTQKMQGLLWHHETLTELLAPLNVSSDRFVNSFPRSLGYNPNQLLAAAHIISAALPGLSIYDIYARAPRILSVRTREVLLPQIERLKRAFLKAEHGGVSKRNQDGIRDYNKGKELQSQPTEDYQDVVGTSVQESFADEEDFIADFDVVSGAEQIALTEEMTQLLSIIGIEGAEHLLRRQQQNGATVSAQQLSHLKESISRDDHDTQLQQVTEIVPVEPAKLFTTSIVSKAETVHGSQGETVDGSQDESDSTDDVRVPCTSNNNERLEILDAPEMSVTRIIIGNLDIFIDRHPYFMDKIGGWIKDFGPGLSHAVLSAVPAVLTKKTTALRPVLKKLHILIAETDTPAVNAAEGQEKQHSAGSSAPSTLSRTSHSYGRLNVLLQEAPALLKKKPSDIDIRLQQLADILSESLAAKGSHSAVDIDNPAFSLSSSSSIFHLKKAQHLAVGAPRLLIESKIERIIFRMRLLLCYNHQISHSVAKSCLDTPTLPPKRWNFTPSEINKKILMASCMEIQTTAWLESLLVTHPFVLAGPSSTLARLYFAHTALGGTSSLSTSDSSSVKPPFPALPGIPKVPLTVNQLGSLLDCNTRTFLARLSELCEKDNCDALTCSYGRYLQVVVKELSPDSNSALSEGQAEHPDSHSDMSDSTSTESSECSDNSNGGVSITESDTLRVTMMTAVEQSERLLCGVFNDLCASPLSFHPSDGDALLDNPLFHQTADAASINIKLSSKAATSSVSTGGINFKMATSNDKFQVNIKEEVLRLDKLCQTVCSVLVSAAA